MTILVYGSQPSHELVGVKRIFSSISLGLDPYLEKQ